MTAEARSDPQASKIIAAAGCVAAERREAAKADETGCHEEEQGTAQDMTAPKPGGFYSSFLYL